MKLFHFLQVSESSEALESISLSNIDVWLSCWVEKRTLRKNSSVTHNLDLPPVRSICVCVSLCTCQTNVPLVNTSKGLADCRILVHGIGKADTNLIAKKHQKKYFFFFCPYNFCAIHTTGISQPFQPPIWAVGVNADWTLADCSTQSDCHACADVRLPLQRALVILCHGAHVACAACHKVPASARAMAQTTC